MGCSVRWCRVRYVHDRVYLEWRIKTSCLNLWFLIQCTIPVPQTTSSSLPLPLTLVILRTTLPSVHRECTAGSWSIIPNLICRANSTDCAKCCTRDWRRQADHRDVASRLRSIALPDVTLLAALSYWWADDTLSSYPNLLLTSTDPATGKHMPNARARRA